MQNQHCHENGSSDDFGSERSLLLAAILGRRVRVDDPRRAGVSVVFTENVHHAGHFGGSLLVNQCLPATEEQGSLVTGSRDAELVDELLQGSTDLFIDKARYSRFCKARPWTVLTSLFIGPLLASVVMTSKNGETMSRRSIRRDDRTAVVEATTGEFEPDWPGYTPAAIAFRFAWVILLAQAVMVVAWVIEAPRVSPAVGTEI